MIIEHENGRAFINGYELGAEPTPEMFEAHRAVQRYLDSAEVAWCLDEGELTQSEFELLCRRFRNVDWSHERWDAIWSGCSEIIGERS